MAVDIFKDRLRHAELFGKPVLTTTGTIPRETVPDGWFCYDMQATGRNPDARTALVDNAAFGHRGSVLSSAPLKRPSTAARKIGTEDYFLHGEELDLKGFCEEHKLDYPDNPIKFELRPASPDEAGFFYALPPDEDARLGTIGHIRIDFGRGGDRFWHTWWPRGPEELNSPEFKGELEQVMDQLRRGVLKDLARMRRFCYGHGGEIGGGREKNYGYIVETENYRYCLRCNPVEGDYQAYLTAFDLREQELNQTQEQKQETEPEQTQGPEMGGMGM